MALKADFYKEIFENEKKWIELLDKNLLNAIYCGFSLKPFYLKKKEELEIEYNLTHNNMLAEMLTVINGIVFKIEKLEEEYKESKSVNIKSLLPFFLTSKMNNSNQDIKRVDVLKMQRDVLKREMNKIKPVEIEDYAYDDFPEDYKKVI